MRSVPRGDPLPREVPGARWAVRRGLHPTVPHLQTGKPSKPRCPLPPAGLQGHSQLARQMGGWAPGPVRVRLELRQACDRLSPHSLHSGTLPGLSAFGEAAAQGCRVIVDLNVLVSIELVSVLCCRRHLLIDKIKS